MSYWQRVRSIHRIGPYLLSRGVSPSDLVSDQDLPASILLYRDAWIERGACLKLADRLVRLTGDSLVALEVAETNRFEMLGPWGEGILRSRTLGDAVRFASTRLSLVHTGSWLAVAREGGQVHLTFGYQAPLEGDPTPLLRSHLVTLRQIIDLASETVPLEVGLVGAADAPTDDLERHFGPRLSFGCEHIRLSFDADALTLPLRHAAPRDVLPPRLPAYTGGAVFEKVCELIEQTRPTIDEVARALDMNVRTVQRHLRSWGVTFEQVLDEYRRVYAMTELTAGERSVTDIAFRLGYSDSAHFTRAVRRWTGLSPREVSTAPQPDCWQSHVRSGRSRLPVARLV